VAVVFQRTEKQQVDCSRTLQRQADGALKSEVNDGEKFSIAFDRQTADELLSS
jgi:hypothetical protein